MSVAAITGGTAMIRSVSLILAMALAVVAAAAVSSVTLAQSQNDITVVGLSTGIAGIPGCTLTDGAIKIYNTSTVYEYQVWVDWRSENDRYGNPRCGYGCEEAQDPCECGQENTYEIGLDTSIVGIPQCWMPQCAGCTSECDNETIGGQCPYDHCTCVYGTYEVTHYKEPEDPNWTAMPPSSKTAIAETERDANCPGEPEHVCEY
jgi:hypothetical protein